MILPAKHLRPDRALIGIGAELLALLDEPKTVSRLWSELKEKRAGNTAIPFDWFILALDLLHIMGSIDIDKGKLARLSA